MARGDDNSPSNREIEAMLTQLDRRVEQLKQNFERYFIGVDRRPPLQMRRDVVREVFEMEQVYINSTALRFRLRSLVQKFNTYKTYWTRTMRQIEEGTYHRDRSRADRRQGRRDRMEQARDEQGAYELDLEADFLEGIDEVDLEEVLGDGSASSPAGLSDDEKERRKQEKLAEIQAKLGIAGEPEPVQPAKPSQAAKPAQPAKPMTERERKLAAMQAKLNQRDTSGRVEKLLQQKQGGDERQISRPATGPVRVPPGARTSGSHRVIRRDQVPRAGGGGDDEARRVYDKLLEAKRRCNEPTDNLSYDTVKRSMEKQRETLRAKRGAKDVDFQVVIKGGKAYLKPETKD